MILDELFVIHGIDDDDTDIEDEPIVLRDKSTPQFRYLSGLTPNDRGNRASSIWKESGSPGKCQMRISNSTMKRSSDNF